MDNQKLCHARESRNPGGITEGLRLIFLDARLRGHDDLIFSTIIVMDY
jgi:hypothetical protein